MWDTNTQQDVYTLTGHSETVTNLLFTPDEQHLISSSEDGCICVWNLADGRTIQVLGGHEGVITALSLSSNQQWLVSSACNRYVPHGEEPGFMRRVTSDRTLRIWDWRNGVELAPLDLESAGIRNPSLDTSYVAFCADGETFLSFYVTSSPRARLWHLPSRQQIRSVQRNCGGGWIDQTRHQTLLFDADGTLFCLETDELIFKLNLDLRPSQQRLYGCAVNPHHRLFVGSVETFHSNNSQVHYSNVLESFFELSAWHLDTGQRLEPISQEFARGENLKFSQDGSTLAGWLCMIKLPDCKNKLQLWKVCDKSHQ